MEKSVKTICARLRNAGFTLLELLVVQCIFVQAECAQRRGRAELLQQGEEPVRAVLDFEP
jgi:hypothetical protein